MPATQTRAPAHSASSMLIGPPRKSRAVLDDSAAQVAVCSTGLIGEYLPIDKLLAGVHDAHVALAGGRRQPTRLGHHDDRHCGQRGDRDLALQAGPSAVWPRALPCWLPGLATMLVVLTTDAVADAATLDRALRAATAKTFDRLDSDGCMSTNDTVLLLASGASGVEVDGDELAEARHAGVRHIGRQVDR